MGYGFSATCDQCGLEAFASTRPGSRWYICRRCEQLVTADFPPYRLNWPDCPKCGIRLSDDRLASHFYENPPGADENQLPCPRCGTRYLKFNYDCHISFCELDPPP